MKLSSFTVFHAVLPLVAATLLLSGCQLTKPQVVAKTSAPKNIILLIGDGMGPQQLGLLQSYVDRAPGNANQGRATAISRLANEGRMLLSDTGPHNALVVDSACSATQLAIGLPSGSEMIGLDADGNRAQTILQRAKVLGKATGLVSDTRITHATPAAFASHQPHRSYENEIAVDLLEQQVDVLLSGGVRYFLPANIQQTPLLQKQLRELMQEPSHALHSSRKDNRHLLQEAQQQGYQLAFNRQQLMQPGSGKLLGLFANSSMQDAISARQQADNPSRVQPDLKEMTMIALERLSQQPNGFFLMIEGGQIDWAGHNNDVGTMLHELLRFDEAVQAVYDWVQQRDDTLVVVTADHETGSFGFSYSAYQIPPVTTLPGDVFAQREFAPNFNFGALSLLDSIYSQQRTLGQIWQQAKDQGNQGEATVASVIAAVAEHTAFTLDEAQAARILARGPNRYRVAGHPYMGQQQVAVVQDFTPFYVYAEELPLNLMGRELAAQQSVVWGTGTHTASPVPVIVWGPQAQLRRFPSMLTHVELGRLLQQSWVE